MAQTIKFRDKTHRIVPIEKLTPGEIDAVERVTGLSLPKIRRMGDICVCEHGSKAHIHKDENGEQTEDTSCTSCETCESHQSDLPMRVNSAVIWVSIKRGEPTLKFSDVTDTPNDEFESGDDDEEADPTEPPHAEA